MRLLLAAALACIAALPASAQHAWTANYPEGPLWLDARLYWAEMTSDAVMAWDGDAPVKVFERKGCGPTSIARYRETEVVVLCHLEGALARLDAEFKLLGMIRVASDGTALRDPNDSVADGRGGVWFTDPGRFSSDAGPEGALYHLGPDGDVTRHADGLFYGNGVWIDQSQNRLLVSEHLARRVLAYPIVPGGLGPAEVLFSLDDFGLNAPRYDQSGPDGLEIGPGGVLWIAEYGTGRLLGWRPDDGLVAALAVDAQFITNIAFGPDGQVAVTGAKDNRTWPLPGAVWVFEREILDRMIRE